VLPLTGKIYTFLPSPLPPVKAKAKKAKPGSS
jgi:hypothetical protein